MNSPNLVLASASPRRAQYLRMLGIEFAIQAADIDEAWISGELPNAHVERLAREKAAAVAELGDSGAHRDALVLAGDTVVVVDREILGKPRDRQDAVEMLLKLQGRAHQVASALALVTPGGMVHSGVSVTDVRFAAFDRALAEAYAATEEPLDKAGAYGIQGWGPLWSTPFRGTTIRLLDFPFPSCSDFFALQGGFTNSGPGHRASLIRKTRTPS
jgi:nucleoside triphosphate pyrophosphatase